MLSRYERTIYQHLKTAAKQDGLRDSLTAEKLRASYAVANRRSTQESLTHPDRLLVAWVSPYPPLKTGVAEYSKQVVAALAADFDVVPVVADGPHEAVSRSGDGIPLAVLGTCYEQFDRVIYNIGNSAFHTEIAEAAMLFPGIVLLHDVYLGHCLAAIEHKHHQDLATSLVEEDGLGELLKTSSLRSAVDKLPATGFALLNAQHVLLHSEHARDLLLRQVPLLEPSKLLTIPHMRNAPALALPSKEQAREQLGVARNAQLIVSFGHINPLKGHAKIAEAFTAVAEQLPRALLHFVGSCADQELQRALMEMIDANDLMDKVVFTGYADPELYSLYISAADIAIQLREETRGETSGAITDCLAGGLPTIVSDIGSFSELPDDVVRKVPRSADINDIASALISLSDTAVRERLANKARQYFDNNLAVESAVTRVAQALKSAEHTLLHPAPGLLATQLYHRLLEPATDDMYIDLATSISEALPEPRFKKRLFIDVSSIEEHDLRTGIQRVVRSLTIALANAEDSFYSVIPVKLSQDDNRWVYSVARNFCASVLPPTADDWFGGVNETAIHPACEDLVLCLDLTGELLVSATEAGFYSELQARGVAVIAAVYDLLPISMPHVFPSGAMQAHGRWVQAIANFDHAVCISDHVAQQLREWMNQHASTARLNQAGRLSSWVLGNDLAFSQPSVGMLSDMTALDAALASEKCCLMVGTIEPRKAYDEVLAAFEILWRQGLSMPLVIVGREGWQHLPSEERTHIIHVVDFIEQLEREYGQLIWLNDASDELLQYVYDRASTVLCASHDEGFGLPIVEAMRHKKHIVARDIPVFREVGGNAVSYIAWSSAAGLAVKLCQEIDQGGKATNDALHHPASITWSESAGQLLQILNTKVGAHPL